ncbi:hypothetical protein F5051DRAFT_428278 [Lentinula edodes]|nr:hypothetical protein F5051DRAFT_428278 [Lentinula edodes]
MAYASLKTVASDGVRFPSPSVFFILLPVITRVEPGCNDDASASTSARVSHAPDALPSPPNRRDSNVDEIQGSCSVVPHLARCSNCDEKKPCVLGRLARFQYFSHKCTHNLAFARHFLEVHGDPGQRTRYSLPTEQWRMIYDRVEQSTNSTSALLELNPLDDQDQRELDRQELLLRPSVGILNSLWIGRPPSRLLFPNLRGGQTIAV